MLQTNMTNVGNRINTDKHLHTSTSSRPDYIATGIKMVLFQCFHKAPFKLNNLLKIDSFNILVQ